MYNLELTRRTFLKEIAAGFVLVLCNPEVLTSKGDRLA